QKPGGRCAGRPAHDLRADLHDLCRRLGLVGCHHLRHWRHPDPALIKHGYPTTYAAALQATSAELGVNIPPSIPMILYGVSAEVSIGELFIAGFGPGILIGCALMLFV